MADMGVYLAFDVDHISMIPTGGELVACRHSIKVDDEDLAGAYELIRKLYQEVRIERYNLKRENDKLRELVHTIWLAGDFRAFLGVGELEERMRKLGIEVEP